MQWVGWAGDMKPISRRDGIWIEIPELEFPTDLLYALEVHSPAIHITDSLATVASATEALGCAMLFSPLENTALAAEVFVALVFAPLVSETAKAADALSVPVFLTESFDTVVAGETLAGIDAAVVLDRARAAEVWGGALVATSSLYDTGFASDASSVVVGGITVDTLYAAGSLIGALATAVSETAWASDTATASLQVGGESIVVGSVADVIAAGAIGALSETATASFALSGYAASASELLSNTITAADLVAGPITGYATLPETSGRLTDALSSRFSLMGVLADSPLSGDALSDIAYQLIVVTNTETGAVSTYTLTPSVTGVVEYRGTLYLAGTDGLYALDAEDDGEREVAWTLNSGFSSFGTDRIKRVQDINAMARTEGTTALQVVSARNGTKTSWDYVLPPLTRSAYRDGVIKVGKGVQSVYYQVALMGTGPSEIDQLRLTLQPLSRRR